jgi:PIN domain nuclease of toxin-antitoxin system
MKLLLDTHALLWFLREPDKIPPATLRGIEDAGGEAAVSLVSLWEIAFKVSLNKLYLPKSYEELFPDSVSESGLSLFRLIRSTCKCSLNSHFITATRLTVC